MTANKNAGDNLAKVLWFYNLLPESSSSTQKIVCPFHEDANPSLLVNFEDGSWYCFGCGKSGDAEKFVRYMEPKVNDLYALRKFNEILKSKKCSDFSLDVHSKKRKRPKKMLYEIAWDYYHGLSKVDWRDAQGEEALKAKEYMKKRGFTSVSLNHCEAKVTYNQSYGIIFPMMDNKKFKGWVCRTMDKEIEKKRKYLYNEGFSRATTLVGDYGSKPYVFVVEGYMDRLKFVQFGYTNVVAILGWKMSDEQIKKLKSAGITTVVSALDNDEYGKRGTKYLRNFFKVIRLSFLKGVKDPGEMNRENYKKMFKKTMEAFEDGLS